jgi:hypothetical protein
MLTKIFNLPKSALTITMGAALLAACSNNSGSPLTPSGPSSGLPDITHIGRAVMPTTSKGNGTYQYISNFGNSTLLEFDYPKSDSSIGSIGGVAEPQGECTNALFGSGKQTFWVTSSSSAAGAIEEFKVGGTSPIKSLPVPSGDIPGGCAMDPATGNLAATIINNGAVVIYEKASGKGTVSQTPLLEAYFAGFDNKSNLYADGFNSGDASSFVELKKGSNKWETLSLSNSVEFPGAVQYDGKYITIYDQEAQAFYGYTCRGTTCALKRTVSISCAGSWIAKGYVICTDAGNNDAEIIKYPAGGTPIATLKSSSFDEPLAAVQVEK